MTSPLVKRFQISLEKNKIVGLTTAISVIVASCIVAVLPPSPPPPKEYQAVGILKYAPPPPTATSTGENLYEQGKASISQEILLADRVLINVAREMKIKDPNKLFKNLKIKFPETPEDPQVIRVEYKNNSKEKSQETLSLLLREMVEESRLFNTAMLRSQIQALTKRELEARTDLKEAEREFYDFMSREGGDLIAAQDGTLFSGISLSEQQQRELKVQLEGVIGQLQSLQDQLGLTPKEASVSLALSSDPIIASLRAQLLQIETQIELLSKKYRPEHPILADLLQQKETYDRQFIARTYEVIGNDNVFDVAPVEIRKASSLDTVRQQIATQLVQLQAQRETIEGQLSAVRDTEQELRQSYERYPTKQLEQENLQQKLQLRKQFHDTIETRLVDAQSAEVETVGSLAIAQDVVVPEPPDKPSGNINPVIIVLGGVIGAGIAGAGVILVLSFFDPILYTAQELRSLLNEREIRMLGELPTLLEPENEDLLALLLGENMNCLDAYERFRSNLRRFAPKNTKVILVTSVGRAEGKSTTAYNLAIASAYAGKRTLLIEADLRSPSNAPAVNLYSDPDAQAEPLAYYGSHNECVNLVPTVENLYIVPSVGPQRKAAAIVESSELRRLLEDARQRFDFVILDTASLNSCNDAFLLQPLTDGIVVVTRPGVSEGSLGSTLEQMVEAEMPILGAVINDVEMPLSEGKTIDEAIGLPGDIAEHLALEEEEVPSLQNGNGSHKKELPRKVAHR
ncbi:MULTISPECIES: polysaccharide biosynthesis tyrosine autokinase [Spirulina sp. CCY15215]|uniref:GumC family protein n=1 Tax=Spirulina sp. CCY15215 TaxID=2767591 RepID=UPI00195143B4|nr:polysaccharide biosynthesis tyrosine autokinase [Spirulina major]